MCLFRGREQVDNASCTVHWAQTVEDWAHAGEQEERQDQEHGKEENVVVEDCEHSSFVVTNLVLLPQNTLLFLLLSHDFVITKQSSHFACHSVSAFDDNSIKYGGVIVPELTLRVKLEYTTKIEGIPMFLIAYWCLITCLTFLYAWTRM